MSPPLRGKVHRTALRQALAGGLLQLIATDHCGWNSTQKALGRDDFRCACSCLSSLCALCTVCQTGTCCQQERYQALAGGLLQLIATDHCGWSSTQRALGRDDFRCVSSGTRLGSCTECAGAFASQSSVWHKCLLQLVAADHCVWTFTRRIRWFQVVTTVNAEQQAGSLLRQALPGGCLLCD